MSENLKFSFFLLFLIFIYLAFWFSGWGLINTLAIIILIFTFFTNVDKRFPILLALIAFIINAFILLTGSENLADCVSVFAFYLLSGGVFIMIVNLIFKNKKWEIIKIQEITFLILKRKIIIPKEFDFKSVKILILIFLIFIILVSVNIVNKATLLYSEHQSVITRYKLTSDQYKPRKTELLYDGTSISQNFISQNDNLSEIVFLFSDRIKYNKKGIIFLELKDAQSKEIVASATIKGKMVKNGSKAVTNFVFKPIPNSKGKEYSFTIWTQNFPVNKKEGENDLSFLFKREKNQEKYYIYNYNGKSIKNERKEILFAQFSHFLITYKYLNFFQSSQKKFIALQNKIFRR